MISVKQVPEFEISSGSVINLKTTIERRKKDFNEETYIFLDSFFQTKLIGKLDLSSLEAKIARVESSSEPTTSQVDLLSSESKAHLKGRNCHFVGIGGGSVLDITKAVANLCTNPGKAEDYQGWDLLKKPSPYTIGIPTLSGTGAEASATCVLMNEEKNLKLGMNSKFTVFNSLIMDPDLIKSVPNDIYVYNAIDAYFHSMESLAGRHRNQFADGLSSWSLSLISEILKSNDIKSKENRHKLMLASFLAGTAIGNSFVGLVHPFSAGLSMVLSIPHTLANCISMSAMEEFYPTQFKEFQYFLNNNNVSLPQEVCGNLDDQQFKYLYEATIVHEKPLSNALGPDFKKVLTESKVRELFSRM